MNYRDINGVDRKLTTLQANYLTTLARKGHLEKEPMGGKLTRDAGTFHRLTERGLAIGVEWHCPLSTECLIEITPLGLSALRTKGKK